MANDTPTTNPFPKFGLSITLLAIVVAFLTSVLVGGLYYSRISEITLDSSLDKLANRTHLIVPLFKESLSDMESDAKILASLPATNGIMRAKRNHGVDPINGMTDQAWRNALAQYFSTILQSRPYYSRVRFIGLADNGRELVSVDSINGKIKIADKSQLLQKAQEPYFRESLHLKSGETYLSKVTLNHANKKLGEEPAATLRLVIPVFDSAKALFGFVVINTNFEQMLLEGIRKMESPANLFIVNESGDYIEGFEDGGLSSLQFHEDDSYHPPGILKELMPYIEKKEAAFTLHNKVSEYQVPAILRSANTIETDSKSAFSYLHTDIKYRVHYIKLPLDGLSTNTKDRYIALALMEPEDRLLAKAYHTQRQSLLLTLIAICCSTLLAWPIAAGLQRYLVSMTYQMGKLKSSEKRALIKLKAIIDNAVDALVTINTKGIIITVNPSCEKMFGYSQEDLIGQNIKMLMPDKYSKQHDDYLSNYQKTHKAKIIGIGREVEGRKKNGDIFPLDLAVSEIIVDNETIYSGIIRDISERKNFENSILAANRKLVKSNAELDDFAYIASHDLKEPLRAIYNHSHFLMEDYGHLFPDDAKSRIDRLLAVALRMDKLIDDLLSFSRLSREEISSATVDMNGVVEDVIKNIELYMKERNAHIQTIGSLPPATGDRVKIVSIIQNLCVNALKYNDRDKKIVEIGFKESQPHDDTIETDVYFVKDNGIGIRKEFKDSVFRIFKRLNNPKLYGEGTGSGLTFTKKNIERHGGTIWFESVVGEGTVFYFTLKEKEHV